MNKKIFVGGDFQILQYLWLIRLLDGYCQKNKIKTIIFEYKADLNELLNNDSFINFSNKYNILYLDYSMPFWFQNKFIKIFFFSFSSFFLAIKIRLLGKNFFKDFYKLNTFTAIWDFAYRESKNLIFPNFFDLFISSYYFLQKQYKARYLVSNNIFTAFLGHTVYHSRAYVNEFRKNNINIFCSSWNLFLQKQNRDTMWDCPSKIFFLDAFNYLKDNNVNKYWKKRLEGKGKYANSNSAAIMGKSHENSDINNVIFLHIFKDTPNHYIDEEKIFGNYVEWIYETLKLISYSSEKWLIKLHPSYKKWKEDQPKIINKILSDVSLKHNLDNVFLDDLNTSNISIFGKAKKIITYSGTSAIEAACFGIKPIIISSNALYELDVNLVFKPKLLEDYKKLILKDWVKEEFTLNIKQINKSKKYLYIRENILNLLSEIEYDYIYNTKESFSSNTKIFKNYNKLMKTKSNYLNKLGLLIGDSITHTVSEDYLNYIIDKNKIL